MMWLTILLTVIITSAIVYCSHWIKSHRKTHPELYEKRHSIWAIVWLILNF